jgi:hypothetical protein
MIYPESIDSVVKNRYDDKTTSFYPWTWYISLLTYFSLLLSDLSDFHSFLCTHISFIAAYFISGWVAINYIVSLTSNSTCLLLVFRKAIDFCILTFFLELLLGWFLVPRGFFWLGFFFFWLGLWDFPSRKSQPTNIYIFTSSFRITI